MPPGYCTVTSLQKPSIAHTGFQSQGKLKIIVTLCRYSGRTFKKVNLYFTGIFALACRANQDTDSLWLLSPYMYPTSYFSEVFTIQQLPGQTIDIKLIPSSKIDQELEHLPDVVTQHLLWQREIVVLTANGTCVFKAHKPYELLKFLMIDQGDPESLFGHYNEFGVQKEQPLANTALLAIHPSTRSEPSVHEKAVKAFFLYGNGDMLTQRVMDPGMSRVNSPFENTMDFNPNLVSTPRQDPNTSHAQFASPGVESSGYISPPIAGSSPFMSSQQIPQQYQQSHGSPYGVLNDQVVFSPRHEALYIMIGRILCTFWNKPLVQTSNINGPGTPPIVR